MHPKRKIFKMVFQAEAIFTKALTQTLSLEKVKGPLFVDPTTGLNDNLSGTEPPVSFYYQNKKYEIVQSLAKWKRKALYDLAFKPNEGLYVMMHAIRPAEALMSKYHDLHVDQYDWEKVIKKEERNINVLIQQASLIYEALKETKTQLKKLYPFLKHSLVEKLTVISSHQLQTDYPDLTPSQREQAFTKKHKAVLVTHIGHSLADGKPHALRAPDYDDWLLNGDLIVWDFVNQEAVELSSMGIRVDASSMLKQMEIAKVEAKSNFHQLVLSSKLPSSIGGGIGRSRVNMFLLEQQHILNIK